MANRRFCDCGCGKELAENDAGRVPLMIQGPRGSTIQLQVHAGPEGPPMLRPECARRITAPENGELLFPKLPRATDQGAETPKVDERGPAIPLQRKVEGGA